MTAACLLGGGLMLWSRGAPIPERITADCHALDQAASASLAALVADASAAGELRLDEALAQLRRARKYCRAGVAEVARADYRSLAHALSRSMAGIPQ